MLKQNPCRHCTSSYNYKGRYGPSYKNQCAKCTKHQEHNEYLKSQRRFTEGEIITSLDELLEQEWVMWHGYTKHIEVIKHTQLSSVLGWLEVGAFKEAIRKEPIKAESEE